MLIFVSSMGFGGKLSTVLAEISVYRVSIMYVHILVFHFPVVSFEVQDSLKSYGSGPP